MTRKQKYLAAAGGCLIIYTILGFLIIPMILTRVVPGKIAEQLNRPVSIEKIRLNPYTLSVSILNMEIKDPQGNDDFVSIKELYANLQLMSVFRGGAVLKEVVLGAPYVKIIRKTGTTFNFSDLLTGNETAAEEPEDKKPSDPFRFAVSDIRIYKGTFVYRDEPFDKTHTMDDINWHVPFVSNFIKHVDLFSEPVLACTVDGATLTLDVKTKPFKNTLETLVSLDISGISLPTYAAYIPKDQVGIKVNSGTLGVGVSVSFLQEEEKPQVTVEGNISLTGLDVADEQDRSMVSWDDLTVSVLPSRVMNNELHIGSVRIESPTVSAVREADQTLNVSRVVKTPAPVPDASPEDMPEEPLDEEQNTTAPDSPPSPFRVDLDKFNLIGGVIRFTDHAAGSDERPVETTLKDLTIQVSGFSNRPDTSATFDLSTALNDTAGFTLGGKFTAEPVSLNCDLDLSGVDLTWFQPYLPENIALVINKGLVATSGHVDMSLPPDSPMSLTVTGKTAVKDFAAVDPEKAESFLSWTDFAIDGIHVAMEPLKISIDGITFKDLSNQVVIFKDGATNLEKIFVSSDEEPESETVAEKADEKETSEVIPIRIGKVSLSNTKLGFMDRSISPHYATRLTLNTLNVTGLTSEEFKAATIKANGNVDGHAPVNITGSLNPLSKDLFVDLNVSFSNMEMIPFSTYTGKYIGKAIKKGKLTLGVDYLIKDKAIEADNQLVLDQFTLGKDVDSPDAMSLPVGLAISLLKDRNGVIDINLPISGRTDDPEFKFGKLVLKALGNLIMKAATSPFSLVSSLVGGGEELRYIEFQPGRSQLAEPEREKLQSIHKLLVERPGLNLDILGYVDDDTDRAALAGLALERKIKAAEIMKALKKGAPDTPETVEAVVQSPEDRERALRRLYKKEILANPPEGQTPKPLNDPTLTSEEMVSALTGTIPVTDADLGLLAMARAREVKAALLSDGTVPPERIYLREPERLTPPEAESFLQSRVELGLN